MSKPADLRSRADNLEARVPPVTAGPRTDDERMWLEKAAALRAEADQIDADGTAPCPECEGTGSDPECDGDGCNYCDQTGDCRNCDGSAKDPEG